MASFIILNQTQAQAVAGPGSIPNTLLAPRRLASGTYILPLAVLDDPAHAAHRDFLAGLTQREVSQAELTAGEAE